ncbi:aldo/keto reductase [Kineococcus sp. T13]|uniref:aldo/keto reductase n=1 Tax=Kineococcus vitellinus TaxID=2696565 RepID=UPI001412D6FC|nr:aldo/keto reductase [Kineococcus vitellinus]NAZ77148.1 aldo/keto reductase [Kineococcus vitellinus]
MTRIGTSELDVRPLSLGTNTFGWTSDEAESHRVLDAFVDAGGDFLDTADVYSAWSQGGAGISETIIGSWFARSGKRDRVVLATKVGKAPGLEGLAPQTIRTAVDASLQRLRTDRVDLYWAHADDEQVPQAEVLGAFDELVGAGKVRAVGASNFTGRRLQEALETSRREGLTSYVALQNHYNLVERSEYESDAADVVAANGLAMVPYSALASGFLTGKYRPGQLAESQRQAGAARYLEDERGPRVLAALDEVAAARGVDVAAVALAWLRHQPTVLAPIASARTTGQLPPLLTAIDLELTAEEQAALERASR